MIFLGMREFNRATGTIGEALAQAKLEQDGFEIVECNYRNKLGEIDIIAKRADEKMGVRLHFIEVKYRRSNAFGSGREAVNFAKQKRIHNIATVYLKQHGLWGRVYLSFDVIEISGHHSDVKIVHLVSCF